MIIYKITNQINGKSYIGKTVKSLDRRISNHLYDANNGSKYYIHKAIRKYGFENFKVEIICKYVDNEKFLSEIEKFCIAYYNTKVPAGYNLTDGGEGVSGSNYWLGKHHSESTRKKISEAQRGDKNHLWGKFGKDNPRSKPMILIHPSGEEERFSCASDACKKYGLGQGCLSMVLNGKHNHHKNFKARFI